MADPKGDKLYVNLGASQARKRVKGFGHGVRKVQTAGRHQAVIIHTATGQHLRELEALFVDVGCANRATELHEPIEALRNLGPASAAWLRAAGISTIHDLRRVGAVFAFRRVKQITPQASQNLLWALAAGLRDIDWRDLTEKEKGKLRAEWEEG